MVSEPLSRLLSATELGRPITVLPELENAIFDLSPKMLGAVQVGLAFQAFRSLELLTGELNLRNLPSSSALLSDSFAASWILESVTGRPMLANATNRLKPVDSVSVALKTVPESKS